MGLATRIILRYIAGYLVLYGLVPQEIADMISNDPDIAIAVGAVLVAAVEIFYALAKKFGWQT